MEYLADIVIGAGALLASAYCLLLSRRLRAFTRLDGDVGKAIAILSQQVDHLTKALAQAEAASAGRETGLQTKIAQAVQAARRLELLMAADRTPHSDPQVSAAAPATVHRADPAPAAGAPVPPAPTPERKLRASRRRAGERA